MQYEATLMASTESCVPPDHSKTLIYSLIVFTEHPGTGKCLRHKLESGFCEVTIACQNAMYYICPQMNLYVFCRLSHCQGGSGSAGSHKTPLYGYRHGKDLPVIIWCSWFNHSSTEFLFKSYYLPRILSLCFSIVILWDVGSPPVQKTKNIWISAFALFFTLILWSWESFRANKSML